ncbi:MAG: 5-demethoxyubiquinol-8 5-hydroxylase UbiM [Brachymonas sp.]|nr:5-demethoxyubiquinol-8 5-hydroxylase UbiM [Brachymonas sp.]
MNYDIIIVGAGPAGLCLARALSGHGLRIALIEQQPEQVLQDPPFDGREIAMTQRTVNTLRQLGVWERIAALDPHALAPLKDAQVFNGPSTFAMKIEHEHGKASELGWFASNHLIRKAAYACVQDSIAKHGDITLITGKKVQRTSANAQAARVELEDGTALQARLLVAADSRFSSIRRAMGLGADMVDFGRSMLVSMVTHTVPHDHVAWEWFGHGQTLALLPMNDDPATGLPRSSVVLTLRHQQIEAEMQMSEEDFSADLTRRFDGRLGRITLISTRHTYPLVGVYPRALVGPRFACVGDAAVGMHPVTAHGFNFGVLSVETLSHLLLRAQANEQDIASPELLRSYERKHRLATRPLYLITAAIARLYNTENPAAHLLRTAGLQIGQRLPLFKRAVAASLTGKF